MVWWPDVRRGCNVVRAIISVPTQAPGSLPVSYRRKLVGIIGLIVVIILVILLLRLL
jgi:hypothetical protein